MPDFFKQAKEGCESELIYLRPNNLESKGRWEIGFSVAENGFEQTSFVNSISTSKGEKILSHIVEFFYVFDTSFKNSGGQHVNVVTDQLFAKLTERLNKKSKKIGGKVRPNDIKNFCRIFVKAQIENPEFDSQTKENLTLVRSQHGSSPILSEKFISQVENSGILDSIQSYMQMKESQLAKRMAGRKTRQVLIKKLDDAIAAGTNESEKCTLIITEGDSAKSSALAGVSSIQES